MSGAPEKRELDPITVQVIGSRLETAAEETRATLAHAAYSVNIKERLDCSAALFNVEGEVVAMPSQATVPIHLSSLDGSVRAVIAKYGRDALRPGDMFLCNDPYVDGGGGSHLPDIACVAPVLVDGALVGFVANLGHHSDIGGMFPGSQTPHATSIFQEGIRIPPVRCMRDGRVIDEVLDLLAHNSRLPDQRVGDFRAQFAANEVGARTFRELCDRYGAATIDAAMREMLAHSARRLRSVLAQLPDGTFDHVAYFDDDGIGTRPIPIKVRATKRGDALTIDFTGSARQVGSALNVPLVGTRATVFCVVKTMLDPGLHPNGGFHRAVTLVAPPGSIVNPLPPAAVGARATTCQIVGDAIAGALSQLVPDQAVAECGSHLAWQLGAVDDRTGRLFVDYQAFAGGHGATSYADGMDAVRVWASGASNAPIEADEIASPLITTRYELAPDTGGPGRHRGGLGVVRELLVNAKDARLSGEGARIRFPAAGLLGGKSGQPGLIIVNPGTTRERRLRATFSAVRLRPGDVLQIRTPGGGGVGDPGERDRDAVGRDLREGKISERSAREDYGLDGGGGKHQDLVA